MEIICAPYVKTAKRKRRGISDTTNARSEQPIIPGNSGWQSPTSARAQFVTGGSPRGFNLGMPARKLCSFAHSADHEQHYNPVRAPISSSGAIVTGAMAQQARLPLLAVSAS